MSIEWGDVGDFIKDNAGNGAALVGTLLTGGVAPALAMGVSMIANVTGTDNPDKALQALKNDPSLMLELEKLRAARSTDVDEHVEAMALAKFNDLQKAHTETQQTVRNGDNTEGAIKWVRPVHSTVSLLAGIAYVFLADKPDVLVLSAFLTLPFTYAGLREVGKFNLGKLKQ